MENINFIPANQLPTTEAEEVSVLCLENGEMKQKAAKGLGGGGGYIMKPTAEELTQDGSSLICTANYDEMAKALESGGHVTIVIPADIGGGIAMRLVPLLYTYIENGNLPDGSTGSAIMSYVLWGSGEPVMICFTNGTYVPNFG